MWVGIQSRKPRRRPSRPSTRFLSPRSTRARAPSTRLPSRRSARTGRFGSCATRPGIRIQRLKTKVVNEVESKGKEGRRGNRGRAYREDPGTRHRERCRTSSPSKAPKLARRTLRSDAPRHRPRGHRRRSAAGDQRAGTPSAAKFLLQKNLRRHVPRSRRKHRSLSSILDQPGFGTTIGPVKMQWTGHVYTRAETILVGLRPVDRVKPPRFSRKRHSGDC